MMALVDDLMDALERDTELTGQSLQCFACGILLSDKLVSFGFQHHFVRQQWGSIQALQNAECRASNGAQIWSDLCPVGTSRVA